jgi:hypothetical protein
MIASGVNHKTILNTPSGHCECHCRTVQARCQLSIGQPSGIKLYIGLAMIKSGYAKRTWPHQGGGVCRLLQDMVATGSKGGLMKSI